MHTIHVPAGKKYEAIPNHKEDTLYIVASGQADFTLNGECRTLELRGTVTVPANTLCSFSNPGPGDLKILEMHFGQPADDHDDALEQSTKDIAA